MTTNAFTEVDYLSQGRGRVTEQFKNKPVFDAYLKLIMDSLNELQGVYKDLMQLRSIDTAVGAQLDLIGDIVGQPRTLVNYDSTIGGLFRSVNQEEGAAAEVDDETYRFLIKARIIANTTRATPEAIISGINFVTGNANTTLVEQPFAHITLEVQNNLTDFQAYFLKGLSDQGSIIPIPIGVTVDYVFFEEEYFGFYEDPNALGLIDPITGYGHGYGTSYGELDESTLVGGYISDLQ